MKFETNIINAYKVKMDITIWEQEKICWLNNFKVPEKFRHKRIGSKSLNELIDFCKENGYTLKLLIPKQELKEFYLPFGFKEVFENDVQYLVKEPK